MSSEELRRSARALILDDSRRILLCRHALAGPPGSAVWAAPGGGVEKDESDLAALRRELREEVGLALPEDPPLVWRQVMRGSGLAAEYDGISNVYFVVHTASFDPRGAFSDAELAAENIDEMRWWSVEDLSNYRGTDLFSPRDLAARLTTLLTEGVPTVPTELPL